jgi:hypothetical protein
LLLLLVVVVYAANYRMFFQVQVHVDLRFLNCWTAGDVSCPIVSWLKGSCFVSSPIHQPALTVNSNVSSLFNLGVLVHSTVLVQCLVTIHNVIIVNVFHILFYFGTAKPESKMSLICVMAVTSDEICGEATQVQCPTR